MKQFFILLLLSGMLVTSAFSQGFSGGFRAGLNFNRFDGPVETDADGKELETFSNIFGFHIGASFIYAFTDLMGVKADLMYSQKGSEYVYDGPSYFVFYNPTTQNETLTLTGARRTDKKQINTYLDLPVQAYVKLGKLEISGGANVGFLLSSVGSGGMRFTPNASSGVAAFSVTLDENFMRDDRGNGSVKEGESRLIDGRAVNFPKTIGAYYEAAPEDEKKFNRIDLGLVGELTFFINKGLYLSGRINYGLADITNNTQDVSTAQRSSGKYILRDDEDRNLSIQAGVGFRF